MEVKLIELRDRGTFIPMMAVRLDSLASTEDRFLLRRAGYGEEQIDLNKGFEPYVLFTRLDGTGKCNYDPYSWDNPRTYRPAHIYLISHWNSIKSGDVIDVEFLLGETTAPKVSERLALSW